ncbi:Arf-GAP domain and FG repeats-containing protein 1 [Fistulifera solaris]|uniref:Arf-GAP domain and FG repeats-containing protein 1 n=1 Tax=Fistulifera solaris TaxID=1519565 RepID=A0A1Z5K7U6_FISSO|nr:Arf-GAP domain and FG repeats-containing protein 1 [Fistulifera solaris]|eukprot:GAX22343.1 Arf-GAP domain and FG repeats-containing protein 1 [Fistulifera solaris]
MLSPPGSSSGAARRATAANRRKTDNVSPDEVIRQLQRVPANKKCADCSSKLPSCVNLTVGTFICMTCAGVHRESNARIKSVGHSSFTAEEAEQLKATDNDQINALYMARYSPSTERLRRPMDNRDPNMVRAWIHRKYKDRAWYGGGGSEPPQPAPAQRRQQRPAEPQPTVVQIPASNNPPPPQRKTPSRQAAVDLFADFDSGKQQQQPTQQQQWDAFGNNANPSVEQPAFEANFANFPSPTSAQPEAFPADFGSAQARQSQPDPFQQIVPTSQASDPFAQQPVQPPVQPQHGPSSQTQQHLQVPNQPLGQPQQALQSVSQFEHLSQPYMTHQITQPQYQGQNAAAINQSSGQPEFGDFSDALQDAIPQQAFGEHQVVNQPMQPNVVPTFQQQNQSFNMSQLNQGLQPSVSATSAADAISAMDFHLEKSPQVGNSVKAETKDLGKYKEGQRVYYKSSSYSGEAEIVKVHLDDELKPYYTIHVNGKEKQTDESHLDADLYPRDGDSSLLSQVTDVLKTLSTEQLQNVLNFAKGLSSQNSPGDAFATIAVPVQSSSIASTSGGNTNSTASSATHTSNPTSIQQPPATQHPPSFSTQNIAGPNATDAFAGIPSPSTLNKETVQLNSDSLPSPNAFQSPATLVMQASEPSAPSYPNQMSLQPQFQQQPMPHFQNMPQMQMPFNSQVPNHAFMQHQLPQGHGGPMLVQQQFQRQPNGFQSQQSPPTQMESPASPKGNPFDFH